MSVAEAIFGVACLVVICLIVWWGLRQMESRLHAGIVQLGAAHKAQIDALTMTQVSERAQLEEIREKLEKLQDDLPTEYVRREDWIRMTTLIDGKLDRINTEQRAIALLIAKGAKS